MVEMKMEKNIIGILGGMGPESTADVYLKIVKICQKKYMISDDADFPQILIYSCPISSTEKPINDSGILSCIENGIEKLIEGGANIIIMICNSIHCFIDQLREKYKVKFISVVEEMLKEVIDDGIRKVGLLAFPITLKKKVYEREFIKSGVEIILPNEEDQTKINKIISNVSKGNKTEKDKKEMFDVVKKLESSGSESVILGCTELSLLLEDKDRNNILDCNVIIAESVLTEFFGE